MTETFGPDLIQDLEAKQILIDHGRDGLVHGAAHDGGPVLTRTGSTSAKSN
jgi:hypothetical protein